MKRNICILTLALLSFMLTQRSAIASLTPRYDWVDLGDFGYLAPNDIEAMNDNGEVIGSQIADAFVEYPVIHFYTHSFLWSQGNRREFFPLSDHLNCRVTDMNQSGVLVGTSYNSNFGESSGCIFDRETGLPSEVVLSRGRLLGFSVVNDHGLAGGNALLESGRVVPLVYDLNSGELRFIETFPGYVSIKDINNSGTIVGSYTTAQGSSRAFAMENGKNWIDLNDGLPTNSAWVLEAAVAINSSGVIVGNGTFNEEERAFRLPQGVNSPYPLFPRAIDAVSFVAGINDLGVAVGTSIYRNGSAVAWTGVYWKTSQAVDVNPLTNQLPNRAYIEGIRAINNRGQMAARVALRDIRQYLLTPVLPLRETPP